MQRRAIQLLFVTIGLAWLGFTFVDFIGSVFGDCGDDRFCDGRKEIATDLVFWRGLCVAIIIVLAYRYFRKDPDV